MTIIKTAKLLRDFLSDSEALKTEIRHSYLSNGREESVAEHVWRMSLLAMMIAPYLSREISVERFLKIIIVHDLVEIYAGDIPITETSTSELARKEKQKNELLAINKIKQKLPTLVAEDIYQLWFEYEDANSYEAKIAHALDKIEAQAQHNEAGIKTWVKEEFNFAYKLPNYSNNEPILEEISKILISEVDEMKRNIGHNE